MSNAQIQTQQPQVTPNPKSNVYGPYQINQHAIDYSTTLDQSDLDRWYLVVAGTTQFVKDQAHGIYLRDTL